MKNPHLTPIKGFFPSIPGHTGLLRTKRKSQYVPGSFSDTVIPVVFSIQEKLAGNAVIKRMLIRRDALTCCRNATEICVLHMSLLELAFISLRVRREPSENVYVALSARMSSSDLKLASACTWMQLLLSKEERGAVFPDVCRLRRGRGQGSRHRLSEARERLLSRPGCETKSCFVLFCFLDASSVL